MIANGFDAFDLTCSQCFSNEIFEIPLFLISFYQHETWVSSKRGPTFVWFKHRSLNKIYLTAAFFFLGNLAFSKTFFDWFFLWTFKICVLISRPTDFQMRRKWTQTFSQLDPNWTKITNNEIITHNFQLIADDVNGI